VFDEVLAGLALVNMVAVVVHGHLLVAQSAVPQTHARDLNVPRFVAVVPEGLHLVGISNKFALASSP
jgi:hypothetical protein